MKKKKYKYFLRLFLVIFILFSINSQLMAQESKIKQFRKLNFPVKWWAITHPFVVTKAFEISNIAKQAAIQKEKDIDLDGDYAGGQVDAFRHGYWMSMLSKDIGARKARKLGRAYERSNKIDFKKKILEDRYLPDYMSSEMDLHNNEVGIKIGLENSNITNLDLSLVVKNAVLNGEFVIIKKNKNGEFLNSLNKIIPKDEYYGKWYSPKTIVPSNYEKP